jgi:predicted nucleic acid-binding protein
MRRIFWDTMLFSYWFANEPQFGRRVAEIYSSMRKRGDRLCSSAFVLGEVLVPALKAGDQEAADAIENFFHSDAVELLSFPSRAARTFAGLRAQQGVKSVDALHLATAGSHGVDAFVTHDRKLKKVVVPGISFILPIESDVL